MWLPSGCHRVDSARNNWRTFTTGGNAGQASGPASRPSGHRAHLKAKQTVRPRAPAPDPDANVPRSTRSGRLGKYFGRLRLAARSADLALET